MARWNHVDRTLHAKLVYYGPSLGGKTATVAALHSIFDPDGSSELLSICSPDKRTLLFDLLSLDLGPLAGYSVSVELRAVPGQVRHDTTRRVILADADALIFVADSNPTRREQNVWSLQNLRMNLRKTGLDPKTLPVLYQLNKQDLPEAAPADQVASWLRIDAADGFGSVATKGRGVLEPFAAACRALIASVAESARESEADSIDPAEMLRELDRALAPYAAKAKKSPSGAASPAHQSIVLSGDEPLECAVRASIALSEMLSVRGTGAGIPAAVHAGSRRRR